MKCEKCNTDMVKDVNINGIYSCPSCLESRLIIDSSSINFGIGSPTKKLDINTKKYKLSLKQKITKLLLWLLWKVADDVTSSGTDFTEIYNNVPDNLKDVYAEETYIYQYHTEKRKEILEWLNRGED